MRKLLLFLSLSALAVAGCQRSTTSSGSGSSGTSGGKVKIVYIPKSTGNPYFNEVVRGFKETAEANGAEFTTTAPSTAEATSQVALIKEQIQRHVDVIAISANSPDALNVVLDEAKQAGIVVVTVDSDLVGNESHRVAAVTPTDFSKVGESQVELLGSQLNYEGEIAILSATRDAPNQNTWIEGMKATLKQPKYAKMKLVDIVYGDDEPQKSATEFEALLAKHPNLRGVISPTSVGLAAAAQALATMEAYPGGANAKGKGLLLTGLSTPNQLKKFVETGVVQGFQLWSPYDMGVLACNLGIAVKAGKVTPKEGGEFDDPKLGKVKFGKNNVVDAGPLVTFNKGNIADYNF